MTKRSSSLASRRPNRYVESGLIVHHDVYNDANDSHMLHPVSVAAKRVLKVDEIQVLADGGYVEDALEILRGHLGGEAITPTPRRSRVASERASRWRRRSSAAP